MLLSKADDRVARPPFRQVDLDGDAVLPRKLLGGGEGTLRVGPQLAGDVVAVNARPEGGVGVDDGGDDERGPGLTREGDGMGSACSAVSELSVAARIVR